MKMEKELVQKALEAGFSSAAVCAADLIDCEERIRAYCSAESCPNFGSSWICPPGCGSIEDCRRTVASYGHALLLQSFYPDTAGLDMTQFNALTREHNRRSWEFVTALRETCPEAYLLTTGGCELCEKCSFPASPCLRPEKRRGSLSAFGIDVGALCGRAGMDYAFEAGKMRLISCVLY